MLEQAIEEFNIDPSQSWMMGDKLSDVDTGKNMGCKTILIESRYVENHTGKKYANLREATNFILNHTNL